MATMTLSLDKKLHTLLNMARVQPPSWVMLDENQDFVPLAKEKVLFTSPPRTTLTLQTPNTYPGKSYHLGSNGGVAFLTNQRVTLLSPSTVVRPF